MIAPTQQKAILKFCTTNKLIEFKFQKSLITSTQVDSTIGIHIRRFRLGIKIRILRLPLPLRPGSSRSD